MNRKQQAVKTIRTVRKKKLDPIPPDVNKTNSQTMQIPLNAIFDDINTDPSIQIQVTIPGKQPFTMPLNEKDTLIGREPHCDIYLPIDNVSREHARIIRNGESFSVEDLDSTNGTYVNNVRIVSCTLHHSDQIRIGEARMTFIRVHPEAVK